MNWDALGSIGELIGAFGVICSVQIRQNTKASRSAMSHSLATAARDWNRPILEDPELVLTFQIGREDPGALSEAESARFFHLCFTLFRIFEDAHFQYRHDALDPDTWAGYEKLYGSYVVSPGFQVYWAQRRDTFHPAFSPPRR